MSFSRLIRAYVLTLIVLLSLSVPTVVTGTEAEVSHHLFININRDIERLKQIYKDDIDIFSQLGSIRSDDNSLMGALTNFESELHRSMLALHTMMCIDYYSSDMKASGEYVRSWIAKVKDKVIYDRRTLNSLVTVGRFSYGVMSSCDRYKGFTHDLESTLNDIDSNYANR